MNKNKKILVGLLLLVVVFCVIFFPIYYRKKHHTKEHFESIWNEYEPIFIFLIIIGVIGFCAGLVLVLVNAKRNNYPSGIMNGMIDYSDRFANP